jgi:MoxR-like ATPase
MGPEAVRDATDHLRQQVHRVVIGQERVVNLLLVALLSEGHVLIEGVPGTAKTLLARTFAASLALKFGRIQFTPDLMPGDVIGTNLFNFQTGEFALTRGPIFTDVLLADEINRTPPKTQAALLEAMQEHSVTIDGKTHDLGSAFLVLATQNPIEQEGTYPLPEAQLDRFLVKIKMGYPTEEQEREIVRLHGHRTAMPKLGDFDLSAVVTGNFLAEARAAVRAIRLEDDVMNYIVALVRATREEAAILFGASPRASNMLAVASRALAVLSGRDFVIPDDVKALALPLLGHRLVLSPDAEIEGLDTEQVVKRIVAKIPAPR